MFAPARRWRPRFSRQQSQRTTRPELSSAGFQPVSSHSGHGMSVQMAAEAVGVPRRAVRARQNLVECLVEVGDVFELIELVEYAGAVERGRKRRGGAVD